MPSAQVIGAEGTAGVEEGVGVRGDGQEERRNGRGGEQGRGEGGGGD